MQPGIVVVLVIAGVAVGFLIAWVVRGIQIRALTGQQRTAQAIGHSAGQFTITDQQEEIGGRVSYTVSTSEGATYRCYLYGATGFQKAMSFGQTPHSDAICTDMVGSKPSSKHQAPATAPEQPGRNRAKACNALQRTAGRC